MNEEATVPELRFEDSALPLEPAAVEALPELVRFANTVADAARQTSLRYFRVDPEMLIKADGSPVSVADRETEQVIRDLLARRYPGHGVFGEEYGWTTSNDPYTWIVDPIGGTKSFLAGAPTYGMLLALLYDGVPVLGIVDIPALDERWCGVVGQTATMNGRPVKTRNCTAVEQAVLTVISPDKLKGDDRPAVEELSRLARVRR